MIPYGKILIFSIIAIIVCIAMALVPALIAKYKPSRHKSSEYECGISPLGDVKQPFDVQFYLVAILFLVFDLEIVLLFPWAMHLKSYSVIGFYSVICLLIVLTVALVYEFKSKAIDW
jgi:NADH:ubiquinone oxidoreductase subunit 3 (subunit A)